MYVIKFFELASLYSTNLVTDEVLEVANNISAVGNKRGAMEERRNIVH